MPSFPQPGKVTIGEINRELVTADHLSDDQARETYGKVLGTVFGPVPFESDSISGAEAEQMDVLPRQGNLGILSAVVQSLTSGSVKALFEPADVKLLQYVDLHAVSWHSYKHILAFISGLHQVTICDYDDSDGKSPCVLSSELQKEVKFIEWRPNDGKTLYVACKGGICIWTASYPGNVASVRAVVTSSIISRSSSTRWTLVDFLRSHDNEQISSLSWSPNGRYLASAAFENSSFTIWDVAQGLGTPFRRGLGGISVLSWSPCGDYFFAAKFDGTFYLWETNTWTSEPWSSKNGFVTGATWDPDGRMILLSFSESSTLGSIHFASKAPSLDNADSKTLRSQICTGLESYIMLSGVRLLSLFAWTSDAHLIPVELPEIKSLTGSQVIKNIAWDASGERLAVSYMDGDELYRGLVALFDVKRTPLISTSLIGFIRGPGDNPKPLAFAFYNKFKQGPLLSVSWSTGYCCTYPLIFR